MNYKRFALEFDNEEITGTFEGLKHLPADKVVVLGLVTTKAAELESLDDLKAQVHEAAKVIAKGQGRTEEEVLKSNLAVSPSCGFASLTVIHGIDSREVQWQKLDLVKKLAEATIM
jgi:methionine synthase II (cobalamin-independent)